MHARVITVMGATGHTGKQITEAPLKAGEKVRALGRSASKLAALKRAGAEGRRGDTNDTGSLTAAFRGEDLGRDRKRTPGSHQVVRVLLV